MDSLILEGLEALEKEPVVDSVGRIKTTDTTASIQFSIDDEWYQLLLVRESCTTVN